MVGNTASILFLSKILPNTSTVKGKKIDFVSHHWVGHDGCRITIDKNNFTSFSKTSAALKFGIIKFAGSTQL